MPSYVSQEPNSIAWEQTKKTIIDFLEQANGNSPILFMAFDRVDSASNVPISYNLTPIIKIGVGDWITTEGRIEMAEVRENHNQKAYQELLAKEEKEKGKILKPT